MAYSRQGNRTKARADLESSNKLLPTALATNELGNLSLSAGNKTAAKQYFAQVAQSSGPLSQSARLSYIKLDLPDNPAPYFKVSSRNRDGNFYSEIVNASGMTVRKRADWLKR